MKTNNLGQLAEEEFIDGTRTKVVAIHDPSGASAELDIHLFKPTPPGWCIKVEDGQGSPYSLSYLEYDKDVLLHGYVVLNDRPQVNVPVLITELRSDKFLYVQPELNRQLTDDKGHFSLSIPFSRWSANTPHPVVLAIEKTIPLHVEWMKGLGKVPAYKDVCIMVPYVGQRPVHILNDRGLALMVKRGGSIYAHFYPNTGVRTDSGTPNNRHIKWDVTTTLSSSIYCGGVTSSSYVIGTSSKGDMDFIDYPDGMVVLRITPLESGTGKVTVNFTYDGETFRVSDSYEV